MINQLLRVLTLFGLAMLTVQAGSFWEKKDFTKWGKKELRKILRNSPWAREVRLSPGVAEWGQGPLGSGETEEGSPNPLGGILGAGGRTDNIPPTVNLIIRWHSALPIRQALVKQRFEDQAGTAPEARVFLQGQLPQYIVAVTGVPRRLATIAYRPERALLKPGKKSDILLDKVELRSQEGALNLYLFFPRTEPIGLEDKNVQLDFKLGPLKFNRKFKLKDMVFEGKLEL